MLFGQKNLTSKCSLVILLLAITAPLTSQAAEVVVDDLIVVGSECLGLDCDPDEEFSFTTLLLKENNLRMFFHDTSNAASFPSNDWEIIANDSAAGGDSFLGIADRLPGWPTVSGGGYCDSGINSGAQCTGNDGCAGAGTCVAEGNIIFLIEAGAPANSLKIDSAGFVGLGSDVPEAELDVNGNAIVRGNLTVDGTITGGAGTGVDQICPQKEFMIGLKADGTIICSKKNK